MKSIEKDMKILGIDTYSDYLKFKLQQATKGKPKK